MSGLTHIEKQKLERELGMESGYVLAFTNRTFEEFFREVVGVEISSLQFALGSGSKANRMRAFWRVASDEELRSLLAGLAEGWEVYASGPMPDSARKLLSQIVNRLGGSTANIGPQQDGEISSIDQKIAEKFGVRLVGITALSPQERGYEFERFLKDLFDAYGLSARASFRLKGEQIDGSFMLYSETYLLEAKWQNDPTAAADLRVFEGKLREKADWSRGLFVSISGFSADGLEAFGRAKRTVCMDGYDLSEMLRLRLPLTDVLAAKVRRAAETGSPFVSVGDLFMR